MLPVVSMSRAMATVSGSFSCLANSSMMRMLAWWGMKAARSSAVTPAASRACSATLAISQTAQRKTVWPSWRSVGQRLVGLRRSPVLGAKSRSRFMPTASAFEPSEPQTVGPMPGSSLGPMTTAPRRRRAGTRWCGRWVDDVGELLGADDEHVVGGAGADEGVGLGDRRSCSRRRRR